MTTYKPYHKSLIESLQDPLEAAAYLGVVFEEGDPEHILLALKNVAEARRNMPVKRPIDFTWADCHALLLQEQAIDLTKIIHLLNDLGLKLSVTQSNGQAA